MIAVGLQSVGYWEFYERVFQLTGITPTKDDITSLFLASEDNDKLYREEYRQRTSVKIRRMREQYRKIRAGLETVSYTNLTLPTQRIVQYALPGG